MKGAQSGLPRTSALGVNVPISVVAERTGLSQATLRAWQHRYGLGPSRTSAGGHRRYGPTDIERLERVRDLEIEGVPAGELGACAARGDCRRSGPPRVLLACTPDELHDLPLIALAAALSAADVRSRCWARGPRRPP